MREASVSIEDQHTDVDDMSLAIDHDVPVVSVLYLKDVTRQRVRRHRLYEVQASFLEGDRVMPPILGSEEVQQVVHFGTAHFVTRSRIRHNINDSAL